MFHAAKIYDSIKVQNNEETNMGRTAVFRRHPADRDAFFEGDLPAAAVDAKYSSENSQFLTLANGTRVHYRDEGNPEGLPVVLIHGAMASLHTWEGWVTALGENYRLITLDLPAHGLTGAAPADAKNPYGSEGFINAIHAVTQALDLRSFVIGGNSMGGGATWRYALAYPERVLAMILVNAVPPNRDWGKTSSTEEAIPSGRQEALSDLAYCSNLGFVPLRDTSTRAC